MSRLTKTSPAAYSQVPYDVDWDIINQTRVAMHFDDKDVELKKMSLLGLTDVSCLNRIGVKGKGAAHWLANQGMVIPDKPNTWVETNNALVLRLGMSEFLIEDQFGSDVGKKLELLIQEQPKDVYHVVRADASFIISGDKVLNMFSELCTLDLSEKVFKYEDVLMTQVADISATISYQTINNKQIYRLWCDGTLGAYMWNVLHQLATEQGGGAVGFSAYFPNK
jgi:sarcosine oxidase subunit gamma